MVSKKKLAKIAAGLAAAAVVGGGIYAAKRRKNRREFERNEFIRKNAENLAASNRRWNERVMRTNAERDAVFRPLHRRARDEAAQFQAGRRREYEKRLEREEAFKKLITVDDDDDQEYFDA